MGIAFVLIFWAIALGVAAVVGSAVFGSMTHVLTRNSPNRKKTVTAAIIFPFACVVFAGAWFIFYAVVNTVAFHRDPGLGDGWETPLPNGYALMMIDTTDQGTVYRAGSDMNSGVSGVRLLQVVGPHIYGARDNNYFQHLGQESAVVDAYFELDTSSSRVQEFKTLDLLSLQAANEGTTLHLRPFEEVFGDYRTTWFDYLFLVVIVLIPSAGFLMLASWIWKSRHSPSTPG